MGNTNITIGPGITTSLTILFVLLKVFDKIDWSWWWVFSPLWLGAAVLFIIIVFVLIIAAIAS